MKALLFAGVAAGLAGFSLQAQEQPTAPAGTLTQSGQTAPDPSAQELLRLMTEMQRQSTADTGAHPAADPTAQTSVVQQLIRLAMVEVTQLQQKLKEDDAGGPSASKDASTIPSDAPAPAAAPSLSDAAFSAFAHAWDSSLSTGGLHTGGLQTGSLQTGHLTTGHVTSGSTTNANLPSRNVIIETSSIPSGVSAPTPPAPPTPPSPPAVVNAPPANVPAALNAPPADPDDEMLRWSQGIDRQYASEPAARRAALRLYPALAVANSAFNAQFLARYSQYRQADPFGFLRGPGWPMKLAIFTAGDLQRQRGGSVF